MTIKNLTCLVLLLLIFSCSNQSESLAEYTENPCGQLLDMEELSYERVKRIEIENDNLLGLYGKIAVVYEGDQEYLYGVNFTMNRIEKFDLGNEKFLKSINTTEHPSLYQLPISEAYFVSPDSIFLFAAGGRIALLNEQVNVLKTWDFSRIINTNRSLSGVDPLNNSESMFLRGGSLFVRSFPPNNWDMDKEFYEKPFMIEFDLETNRVKRTLGRFPSYMKEAKKHFVNDFKFGWSLSPKGELLVSYRRGHCLAKLNLETEEQEFIPASSGFLDEFELVPREYNSQLARNIVISEGIYHNLLHDPYRKLYYRVVSHKQTLHNPATNRLNSADKKH